ncbi:MAG: inositol monophosphatase [Burkholderiales bacterium]|nr:inositol monophosphatase [Burkholderiales bacterium]
MSGIINIATKAAYLAGNLIQQASRNPGALKIKKKVGNNNYVTDLDIKSEQIIIETIKKAFPEHNILSEEIGEQNNQSEYTWIIDPIDGTTNFIHGNPQYSISIALKYQGNITHGVIFDPNRNDLYSAELGRGAYVNDKRLRVAKTNYLEDALIGTGFPTYDMEILDKYLLIFKDMLLNSGGQRRAGSAALDLAYVAAGYLDGFWEFKLNSWDIAAGYILIKEAGGVVTDFNNTQNFFINPNTASSIVAGNPKILVELLKVIQNRL